MRLLATIVVVSMSTGCMAYMKQGNRTRTSARREAADIALAGAAQLIIGGLITVGSYYWFNDAKRNPEPLSEDELSPAAGAVLGMLLGGGIVLSGVGDETIALYQGMSNDYVLPPVPAYWPRAQPGAVPTAANPPAHANGTTPLGAGQPR